MNGESLDIGADIRRHPLAMVEVPPVTLADARSEEPQAQHLDGAPPPVGSEGTEAGPSMAGANSQRCAESAGSEQPQAQHQDGTPPPVGSEVGPEAGPSEGGGKRRRTPTIKARSHEPHAGLASRCASSAGSSPFSLSYESPRGKRSVEDIEKQQNDDAKDKLLTEMQRSARMDPRKEEDDAVHFKIEQKVEQKQMRGAPQAMWSRGTDDEAVVQVGVPSRLDWDDVLVCFREATPCAHASLFSRLCGLVR